MNVNTYQQKLLHGKFCIGNISCLAYNPKLRILCAAYCPEKHPPSSFGNEPFFVLWDVDTAKGLIRI